MEDFKPGQVIAPQQTPAPTPPPVVVPPSSSPQPTREPEGQPEQPVSPAPPFEQTQATPVMPAAEPQVETPAAAWQFRPEEAGTRDAASQTPRGGSEPKQLTWTAAEFIAHEKSAAWYGMLAAGGVVLSALIYFMTKDVITTGIVAFCVLALGLFAARKPHEQTYILNEYGLKIGQRVYAFHDYKSFAVIDEGTAASVVFMPLKRFLPALTVYLDPTLEERIVDYLADILPFEEHRRDVVDSLMNRIRF